MTEAAFRLEPMGHRHLGVVAELVRDPAVLRFTRVPEPLPERFAEAWLARYEEGRRDGTREAFAILDDERVLGLAVAPAIDPEARELELGYLVAPEARGRGVATWALRALTNWAFIELGALRAELLISVENVASKRVAERCGYELEGVLRSRYVKPGRREDTEIWSRLAPGVGDGDLAG
jgi:RimJ/RimL family protein N-acetyltransferase